MQNFKPEKVIVLDDRIASSYKQQYALNVGPEASRINYTTPSSNSANQLQFNVQNTDIETRIDSHCYLQLDGLLCYLDVVQVIGAGIAQGTDVFVAGIQAGPKAFPVMANCVNNTTTIMANETFSLTNNEIQQFIFRLMDTDKLFQERTCPSSLDRFVYYSDATATTGGMNVLGGYFDSGNNRINNSSYQIVYTDWKGTELTADTASMYGANAVPNGLNDVRYVLATNKVQSANAIGAAAGNAVFRVYLKIKNVTEPLISNPWSWDEPVDLHKSLHDVQNFSVTLNMNNQVSLFGVVSPALLVSAQGLNPYVSSPFVNPILINYYYQLPIVVKDNLPCVKPFLEYERTNTTGNATLASGLVGTLTSAVIPLTGVPDMILIGVVPTAYNGMAGTNQQFNEASWFSVIQNISISWGAKENLMSSLTTQELYKISFKNGLKMNALEFGGSVNSSSANALRSFPTVSSFVVIKPGLDFDIGDLTSGMATNKNLQIKVQFKNQSNFAITPQLRIVLVNSAYAVFENARCDIVRFPVGANDLFSTSEVITHSSIKRMVGAGVLKNSANNMMLKHYKKSKSQVGGSPHSGGSSHSGGDAGGAKKHSKKTAKSRAK